MIVCLLDHTSNKKITKSVTFSWTGMSKLGTAGHGVYGLVTVAAVQVNEKIETTEQTKRDNHKQMEEARR